MTHKHLKLQLKTRLVSDIVEQVRVEIADFQMLPLNPQRAVSGHAPSMISDTNQCSHRREL
jgi:hypothetical protein